MPRPPVDWHPLCTHDPLPGDPAALRAEAAHLRAVAERLHEQAEALRLIGDDEVLRGRYADSLREHTHDLAARLATAATRYARVHRALDSWAGTLHHLRSAAARLLDEARAAGEPGLPPLRARLSHLTEEYEDEAARHARLVRTAVDDALADSLYDDFAVPAAAFVSRVLASDTLDDFVDALGWAATLAGFAAMFFPALGPLALGASLSVAALHLAQAATGTCSWFDVVLDIVALKFARDGVLAARAVGLLQGSARTTAAGLASDAARGRARGATSGARRAAARRARRRGGGVSGTKRRAARARRLRLEERVRRAGLRAGEEVHAAPLPQITGRERTLALGDVETGRRAKDVQNLSARHPEHGELRATDAEARRRLREMRGSWAGSTALDLGDKTGDDLTGGLYGGMKDRMRTGGG
ncbi:MULTISPECIES: hypothetical protein [unclassified Streptomyces]|uniref:hypothetical protein n=1 Tax=unclassified Streptomyces TaxID=2593676 RepID=UPI0004C6F81F|nr:hypothetical protein [Streptomyces sp. NRRL F-5630]